MATFGPPPAEMLALRAALRGNQADTDRFYSALFHTTSPEEFCAREYRADYGQAVLDLLKRAAIGSAW